MFESYLVSGGASVQQLYDDVCKIGILQEFAVHCADIYRLNDYDYLRKSDFSPRNIVYVLPFIVISEVLENDVIFRLAGTLVEPIFDNHPVSGKSVKDFVPYKSRDVIQEFFRFGNERNLVSLQEEDLELVSGDVLSCTTLGFPFADTSGKKRYRVSASYYTHQEHNLIVQNAFNMRHSKVHNIRFAYLDEFMRITLKNSRL
jgi:hypothetical protein